MCFRIEVDGQINIINLRESRLDSGIASKFKSQIGKLIKEGNRVFLIDLQNISFIDSSGLGAIAACRHQLQEEGIIILCNGCKSITDLLELTRMDKMFRHFDTREAALVHLQTTKIPAV